MKTKSSVKETCGKRIGVVWSSTSWQPQIVLRTSLISPRTAALADRQEIVVTKRHSQVASPHSAELIAIAKSHSYSTAHSPAAIKNHYSN